MVDYETLYVTPSQSFKAAAAQFSPLILPILLPSIFPFSELERSQSYTWPTAPWPNMSMSITKPTSIDKVLRWNDAQKWNTRQKQERANGLNLKKLRIGLYRNTMKEPPIVTPSTPRLPCTDTVGILWRARRLFSYIHASGISNGQKKSHALKTATMKDNLSSK